MSTQEISFTINDRERTVRVARDAYLLELIREDLGLTGTKEGCGDGECGACTVLVDGLPLVACIFPAAAVQGRRVETIENLGSNRNLHPLQDWFLKLGAVQCGFCIPGLLMACKALLDVNPDPSEEQIKTAISGNLCRCTGYLKVVEAVQAAGAEMRGETSTVRADQVEGEPLGRSLIRPDGRDKVLGISKFAADLSRPEMLHAAMVVSPHAHALIKGINPNPALETEGVVRVLTGADVPGEQGYGPIIKDQPFLPVDKVRYAGDPVAVVLAESRRSARLAVSRVEVDYDPLPHVFDPRDAMQAGAEPIHGSSNILLHRKIRKGDVRRGFDQAEVIVEREFTTQTVDHAYLEPEASLAYWDSDMLVIHCISQGPHYHRHEIARMLGLPIGRVRVIQAATGGGFGGKIDLLVQHFTALGTFLTGRPVKMVWSREESLRSSIKRHAFYLKYRFGATAKGRLTAAQAEIIGNTGAYASFGPAVLTRSATMALGPYDCPNVRVDSYGVYTNTQVSGAMRGFGAPQMSPCHEPLMDEIGQRCGLDPVEIRRLNMVRPGSSTVTQQILDSGVGALETLERVAAEIIDYGGQK